ncbi:MAG: type II 3-dehydroquinate dehydratase [Acidimicrobiia bacterium]
MSRTIKTHPMRFLIINGPNLNLLGTREPDTYGSDTLETLTEQWTTYAEALGHTVEAMQSNHEGALIDAIQRADGDFDGIVINPGAYTHYSYAIHDALAAVSIPAVEVHLSNIKNREEWRAKSVVSPAAVYTIYGRGGQGYIDAMNHLVARQVYPVRTVTYGRRRSHVIDIRVPETPIGSAVLVHGGFWRAHWTRDLMDRMAVALTSQGWVTANVEYRRGPGTFGASNDDILAAVDQARIESSGVASNLPLAVVGHSAGGYLAIRHAQFKSDLLHTVGLAPVVDIDAISASRPDDDPIVSYLGSPRADMPGLWDNAQLSGKPASPTTIIHGRNDESVPFDQSAEFADAHSGISMIATDEDHMACIDPDSATFAAMAGVLNDAL